MPCPSNDTSHNPRERSRTGAPALGPFHGCACTPDAQQALRATVLGITTRFAIWDVIREFAEKAYMGYFRVMGKHNGISGYPRTLSWTGIRRQTSDEPTDKSFSVNEASRGILCIGWREGTNNRERHSR